MKAVKELKNLKNKDVEKKLTEAKRELMKLRSQVASKTSIKNPYAIKMLKKTIARLNTIKSERLKQRNE